VTDQEQNRFEAELRRSRPARLPEDLWSRLLAAAQPTQARHTVAPRPAPVALGLQRVLRYFVPVTAAALVTVIAWRHNFQQKREQPASEVSPVKDVGNGRPVSVPATVSVAARVDDVQVAEELVSSFDTLATLPGGRPVRFRCRQWMDKVTLSDRSSGLTFEGQTPRIEVVPVRFETY